MINRIRLAREKQLKKYEELKKAWDKKVAGTEEPEEEADAIQKVPQKTRVLWVEDNGDMARTALESWQNSLPEDEYEIVRTIDDSRAAGWIDETGDFDVIIFDPGAMRKSRKHNKEFLFEKALKASHLIIAGGLVDQPEILSRIFGDEILEKASVMGIGELLDDGANIFRSVREEKLRTLEAKQEAANKTTATEEVLPPKPVKPEKFRTLFVDDDGVARTTVERSWERNLDPETYEIYLVDEVTDAKPLMEDIVFDLIVYDYMLPYMDTKFKEAIAKIPFVVVESGFTSVPDHDMRERLGEELFSRSEYMWKGHLAEKLPILAADYREQQLKAYEEELEKWRSLQEDRSGKDGEDVHPDKSGSEIKIFIVDNKDDDARHLHGSISESIPESIVSRYNIMYLLNIALANGNIPDIVVVDSHGIKQEGFLAMESMGKIIERVKSYNPNVRVIVVSDEAALISEEGAEYPGVEVFIEKPFHLNDVVDAIKGTLQERKELERTIFKINEAGRSLSKLGRGDISGQPARINVWKGYVFPEQEKALTRIRRISEKGGYKISFRSDIDYLIALAVKNAHDENAVTIIPHGILTDIQKEKIRSSKARVLYMDMAGVERSGEYGITNLVAIVGAGAAYISRNTLSLMGFYALLTGEKPSDNLTVEKLMGDPERLIFILDPMHVYNYNELRLINDRIEKVMTMA